MSKTETIARLALGIFELHTRVAMEAAQRGTNVDEPKFHTAVADARMLYAEVERQERQAYGPTKEDDGA